jgi:hypothetical protein
MLFLVLLENWLQFFRFFRIELYILKAVSVTTLQPRGRVASVLPQDKKWLGTALVDSTADFMYRIVAIARVHLIVINRRE